MSKEINQAKVQAIEAEAKLLQCYQKMVRRTRDPKVKSVLRDMMLTEEMNEILLKTLN